MRTELDAERAALIEIVNADVSGNLGYEWLLRQKPLFDNDWRAEHPDEIRTLRDKLDSIAVLRDEALERERAAIRRLNEIIEQTL